MANERKTEKLVRDRLTKLGYYKKGFSIYEQQCDNPKIDKLLKNASKKGGSKGYPEFIIQSDKYSDLIIVIECKADPKKHESKTRDKYSEYAVDGVLLYASFLSKEYDVIAVAVSGEKTSELICFLVSSSTKRCIARLCSSVTCMSPVARISDASASAFAILFI